ncbi:MAG: GNAT family N-acetyltransferase [Anaerolineales bacterium]|nr:GNAT family N-acetyltransferase [Anaerolineales bacterium]
MDYSIVDLKQQSAAAHREAAEILVAAFSLTAPKAWPTVEDGVQEVQDLLAEQDCILLAALDPGGEMLGWVGAQAQYDHAWELHPLAVQPGAQRRGLGAALVRALEEQLRARGVLTVYLGTDDEVGQTSLAGRDLYPDVLAQAAAMHNVDEHAFEFYQKLGYVVVGLIPDANGFGKPDILMAKRLLEL